MLNVNRLANSTRLEIAAAIADEVFSLGLDDEAYIHELRRYGFTQAFAESMTFRYVAPDYIPPRNTPRKYQKKPKCQLTSNTSPRWVFVDNVLIMA